MKKITEYLLFVLVISSVVFSEKTHQFSSKYLTDSMIESVNDLLKYEDVAKKIKKKGDRYKFYQAVSEEIAFKIADLKATYHKKFQKYEKQLTKLSEKLEVTQEAFNFPDAPQTTYKYKPIKITKETVKKKIHPKQAKKLKTIYLSLKAYYKEKASIYKSKLKSLQADQKNQLDKTFADIPVVKGITSKTNVYPKTITIHIMEFDNLEENFRFNWLSKTLPNLIKEKYASRSNVNIQYAGTIEPYFVDSTPAFDSANNILVNGSFFSKKDSLKIIVEVFDLSTWETIGRSVIVADYEDIASIYDQFIHTVGVILKPHLPKFIMTYKEILNNEVEDRKNNKEVTKSAKKQDKKDKSSSMITEKELIPIIIQTSSTRETVQTSLSVFEQAHNRINNALDELEIYADEYYKLRQEDTDRGQFGTRYFREFDLDEERKYPVSIEQDTKQFIKLLDGILENPYDVLIGEMEVIIDRRAPQMVTVQLPIDYSLKNNLIQEMFINLPHEKVVNKNGNILIKFPKEYYQFTREFMKKLSLMEFQITPVILLTDKVGKLQLAILDSWEKKYNQLESSVVDFVKVNKFYPLLAVLQGEDDIQISIDKSASTSVYRFSAPIDKLGDYSKVIVKFIPNDELESFLSVTLSNK
ncbi:MAG: hypothetical protein ISR90_04860 [Candidatus Marinimicrobia bacterium]|nr:hypothetical protein [Candidatus Neomarinimicrobiota bacterium]MBL7023368.1 hypothetical protein [Candidatus Neomarinimicrobiota bacterium]MBL7109327.1 hypothetical protein [Candidatus Neomarinimicrobiota bacterium]